MSPQCTRLMKWLSQRPIHNLQAWRKLGIYRLASRISELRNDYDIDVKDRWIDVTNQWGESCHVKQYFLEQIK